MFEKLDKLDVAMDPNNEGPNHTETMKVHALYAAELLAELKRANQRYEEVVDLAQGLGAILKKMEIQVESLTEEVKNKHDHQVAYMQKANKEMVDLYAQLKI